MTSALKDWRIAANAKIEEERRRREEEERRKREEEERRRREEEQKKYAKEIEEARKIIGNTANVPTKKVSARKLIDSIEDPAELRKILVRVIDLDYEYILNTILNKQ